MGQLFKKLICKHDYQLERVVGYYYDYSGYRVQVRHSFCSKCGKRVTRKYW